MSCNFLLYHLLHWFLYQHTLNNESQLSKVTISLVASSCLTEICRQRGPLEVQDFGSSCSLDINWLAVYTVSSNYRNSIQGFREESWLLVSNLQFCAPDCVKMAVISHKIVDTWRPTAVWAGISSCRPPGSPILVSTAVRPRLQTGSETRIDAKIGHFRRSFLEVGGCKATRGIRTSDGQLSLFSVCWYKNQCSRWYRGKL